MKQTRPWTPLAARSFIVAALVLIMEIVPSAAAQEVLPKVGIRDYARVAYRFCVADIFVIETTIPEIPVGCETIDCCPGCPGPGPLDWRIRLSGTPLNAMTLVFENLSAEAQRKLTIEGNARWAEGNRLRVGRGETIVRGFDTGASGRPPVAMPRVDLDSGAVEELRRDTDLAEATSQGDMGELELVVEQLLGSVVVNEYVLVYRFRRCLPPGPLVDIIDIDNNAGNDKAVVLLDARSAGCVNDQIYRGSDKIFVGNVLSAGTCNSEVAVFSDNDAVQLITPVTLWTDVVGDKLPVDLTPDLWQAPVTVWIALAGAQPTAQVQIAQANVLYNTNHAGIAFNANYQNVSGNAASVATIGVPSCTAANIAALQGSAFYNANQFNVYYVNTGVTGYNCIADRNIIVVGTGARPATLAHEFGHAFTLAHVNTAGGASVDYNVDGVADFGNTNVMWGGGIGRTTFSEPQGFRMSLNPTSLLITNGVRTFGPTRTCGDATVSATCPWLGLDAVPN